MNKPSLLTASLWAGLLALDITGCGPWMISQPMICGPIFGWLLGYVKAGLLIGGIVQLLWMDVTPVGVGIPFDATAVTLLAVYWGSLTPLAPSSHLILALTVAVPFGVLFRYLDRLSRRVNTWGARQLDHVSDEHLSSGLAAAISAGLVWGWLRYVIFYVLAMWAGEEILAGIGRLPLSGVLNRGLSTAVVLLPVAGLGVTLELFLTDEPERRFPGLRNLKWPKK